MVGANSEAESITGGQEGKQLLKKTIPPPQM